MLNLSQKRGKNDLSVTSDHYILFKNIVIAFRWSILVSHMSIIISIPAAVAMAAAAAVAATSSDITTVVTVTQLVM